ncbi:MAG: pimeloyl-ACP methyl ester carboxylesterase [Oleiphilaceae bacterium]|jgi:abhydrolase domain-containing protein 6
MVYVSFINPIDLYKKDKEKNMKKLLLCFGFIIAVIASFHLVSNHYRYEFYDWAIDFEASKAELVSKTSRYPLVHGQQDFTYFESPKRAGQESIIMLHGFSASKENWLRFSSHLYQKYHIIALDLLGHGANKQDFSQSYSVESQVEYVRQVALKLGLDKFHLVGNSMGGAISSLYAATHPQHVLSATLISPAGVHDIPSKMDELLEEGINPLIALNEDDFVNVVNFVMEEPPFIPAAIIRVEAEKAASRTKINQRIFEDLHADIKKGFEVKLKQIQAPVLIIWGDQDRAINAANIDKYAALIPNAKKRVLKDIGHLAMIEAPEVTALAVLDFFEANKI